MFIFVPFVRISEGQLMLNDIFFISRAKPVAIHCDPVSEETSPPRDARHDGLPQRRIYSARVVDLHLSVGLDFFAHSGQSVSPVGGEVLSNAHIGEEIGFHTHDIFGSFIAVEFTE